MAAAMARGRAENCLVIDPHYNYREHGDGVTNLEHSALSKATPRTNTNTGNYQCYLQYERHGTRPRRCRALARSRTVLSYRVAVSTAGARKQQRSFLSTPPAARPTVCMLHHWPVFDRVHVRRPDVYAAGCASILSTHTRPSVAQCGMMGREGYVIHRFSNRFLSWLFLLLLGVSTIIWIIPKNNNRLVFFYKSCITRA